ncbi:conjugal transfer protein TraV [Novosphingobium sp.]|jgi:conjugal transfer pilus assembly protein TraV|uniref:conjugal transfer protein TraV n=1 Tax=Novosphingobium sp. TaxID=1874826 RepID=UPI003BAD2EC6
MSHHLRLAATLAPLCLSLTGCVGLGTNVKGEFTCRAPSGTCAPSRTIDERATKEIVAPDQDTDFSAARQRAGIAAPLGSDDPARTAERRLRVVFPAHVDESGTLHDEAVAWTVIEAPHWAAELGANSSPSTAPLARQIGRQLKAAQAAAKSADEPAPVAGGTLSPAPSPSAQGADDTPPFELASPSALPSTVGEAIPGVPPPVAEGSDMPATPHVRTSRPSFDPPQYPSAAAIDAARRAAAAKTASPKEPRP